MQRSLHADFAPFSPIRKRQFTLLPDDGRVFTLKRMDVSRGLDFGAGDGVPVSGPALFDRKRQAPAILLNLGKYRIRLASTLTDRDAACRLRFKVFNIELGEGLESSYRTGLDQDYFDLFCDHLIVEDRSRGEIVGTYRMQSGQAAADNLGYYSEQEFVFTPFAGIRSQVLELGRASIDREHRTSEVLTLLWRGIAQYARHYGLRYLIGCSSLNSHDPQDGWALDRRLRPFLAEKGFRTRPAEAYELPPGPADACLPDVQTPRLLRSYIAVGARICGAPAWDREFGTIDFLTMLDLAQLSTAAKNRFLPDSDGSRAPSAQVFVS